MKLKLFTVALSVLLLPVSAKAQPIIHGEIDYDLGSGIVEEWQVGPVFSLNDELELELPIGQSEGQWETLPELKYELCRAENCSIELRIGTTILFSPGEVEPFGGVEGKFGF
jgi:hypothetical protein